MPFIIGLIGIVFAAYFWAQRARAAGDMAHELADMASDVMGAARRFGFRRRANVHPVDSTDDPRVMDGALAIAFLELGGLPSVETQNAAVAALGRHLGCDVETARELAILGRWLMNESNGPAQSIPRLAKRLYRLSGPPALMPLMAILKDIGAAAGGDLSIRQKEALDEIARIFKLS
ncbi:hypothetical protein OU426_16970 [Frigidibacter sp. RF13]|uniref:hypothetical protein n=1 Tax=Frigidibacter sp. RF13 TaxID=2997340 RepID=UPI00226EA0E9|nr:hypothetical protein [Frigidibacter sp. RF13]MCY1128556.1 hypothetical protein [Frigidibacter sp. RF13]